jgi:LuxR family transcriptional regulator, maltose regulon positive regulatory protein
MVHGMRPEEVTAVDIEDALTPLLGVPEAQRVWVVAAFLLGAITGDALGDPDAAVRAVERALDLAEAGTMLFPFLSQPAPGPTYHQARPGAASAALISQAVDLLARAGGPAPPGELTRPEEPGEPLTDGETRVLHYLSSHLSAREIAHELYLSTNTVKTHQRHLYRKLDARTRTQAVERARALGLLTPSSRRPRSKPEMVMTYDERARISSVSASAAARGRG